MTETDTATPTTESSDLDVKIEDAGPALKRLTITIPPDVISDKIDSSLGAMASQAALPGFRKGRAPRALIERRFGTSVRAETKNQIVAEAYSKALEDNKIKPISDPTPVTPLEEIEIVDGKPLKFTVEVEVVPDFELPALDSMEVKKPLLEVTDERVEQELKRQQQITGTPQTIEGDFKDGDRLAGRIVVRKEGEEKPLFHADRGVMVLPTEKEEGKGQVYGIVIEDMTKEFKGKNIGDTVTFKATGPEQHELESVRGADITIDLEIRAAERIEPATVEQVVEHYGLGTEENLREQIKLALEYRRDQEQIEAMRSQVSEYLVKEVDFALPERLSGAQASRAVERKRLDLLYMGLNPDEVESHLAEIRGESEEQARKRLKLFFIVHKLSEQFNIEVNEQEVNGRIAAIAAQRGIRPEKLRAEMQQSGRINEVALQIREHKAFDRVIASAKVTEVPGDEWNKSVTEKSKERAAKRSTAKAGEAATKKKSTSKKKAADE
jgi:trigger factor